MEEMMSKELRDRIVKALKACGATLPCPRCGNKSFTLLDGYFIDSVASSSTAVTIGGRIVPTISVVCTKCGYISKHALAALGVFEVEKAQK